MEHVIPACKAFFEAVFFFNINLKIRINDVSCKSRERGILQTAALQVTSLIPEP